MRSTIVLALLWLAAADALPPEDREPRETAETERPREQRSSEGGADPGTFVPSERIGAETTVSFPADI